ncbi:MAG: hypothetical protein ABFQ82_06110 [Thermodesulfobacteriota bacterium]
MDIDISKVLTYEIKKEIAERYFGFRKLIEEDKDALARLIRKQSITTEQKIVVDLARIYIILKDPALIESFLELSGLEDAVFFDEYMTGSPTIRERVFAGVKAKGFTRKGRFKNLLLGCYQLLVEHVDRYREKFAELLEGREVISEEIKLFYRKNDIGSILGFLRSLDNSGNDLLAGPVQAGGGEALKKKMEVVAPSPVESFLPVLPPLAPLPQIRREMKKLAEEALAGHPDGFEIKG